MKVMVANYISANRELVHENNFDIFFRVILLLPWEADLCLVLMTNTKCIVCLSFLGSQAKPN